MSRTPLTQEDAKELFNSNKELTKEMAVRQERYYDKQEIMMEKWTTIMQQIASSMATLNHNSDTMTNVLQNFDKTQNEIKLGILSLSKGVDKREKNYMELIKYLAYGIVTVAGGVVILKGI